jgi:hypothetical protein
MQEGLAVEKVDIQREHQSRCPGRSDDSVWSLRPAKRKPERPKGEFAHLSRTRAAQVDGKTLIICCCHCPQLPSIVHTVPRTVASWMVESSSSLESGV